MARTNLKKALADLELSKRQFGKNKAQLRHLLAALSQTQIPDAESLIHLHESLLFLRAYPPNKAILRKVEVYLKSFAQRVQRLVEADADLSVLDDPEVSGIVGGSVTTNFSYALVRWLAAKYPRQIAIDWDWFEEEDRFGASMPRFLPLLEDDAMVEAHVPYREWLRAAKGRKNELIWLIEQFESLEISDRERAELYDSLKLHVTWRYPARASRTEMKTPTPKIFFHDEPLIQRKQISLEAELNAPKIPIEKLSALQGQKILDLARETSAVRYRELHGFTYGESSRVLKANLGRGTEAFVVGVSPENRLPLRAYHAALILKNGVPVGYFEGLSLFERMESGFNLYYTFRDGETAWLYSRILHLMRQLLGVTVFSIDPYQVGHQNEEGIESGAFWFYRKLGFRPVRPELMKLAMAEEEKISARLGYRTSPGTLRKLASGHMLFEMPGAGQPNRAGEWDRFEVRNLGLAVQQRMANDFDGDAHKIRARSTKMVTRILGIDVKDWPEPASRLVEGIAVLLATIPKLAQWSSDDERLLASIVRAKATGDETHFLHLTQYHDRLKRAVISLARTKRVHHS